MNFSLSPELELSSERLEIVVQTISTLASLKRVKRWIEEEAALLTSVSGDGQRDLRPRASTRIQGNERVELSITLERELLEGSSLGSSLSALNDGDERGERDKRNKRDKRDKRALYWDQVHHVARSRWRSISLTDPLIELASDDHFIAVLKASGLPTAPTIDPARDSLYHRVYAHLDQSSNSVADHRQPYLRVTHRLDRDTSGVVIMSRHPRANGPLGSAFEHKRAQKRYWLICARPAMGILADYVHLTTSLVSSKPPQLNGLSTLIAWSLDQGKECLPTCAPLVIDAPIGRMSGSRDDRWRAQLQSSSKSSPKSSLTYKLTHKLEHIRDAQTSLYLLATSPEALLIEARPYTGRTHQIRVHLEALGASIFGDTLYQGLRHPRLMLHARHLSLPHPMTHEQIALYAPLPRDWSITNAAI